MYSDYPRFYSGSGWVMGAEIGRLTEGEPVGVCQTQTVGLFGVDAKIWYQIQFVSTASGESVQGWVFSEEITRT